MEQHLDKLPAIYFPDQIKEQVRFKRVQKLSEKIPSAITENIYAQRIDAYSHPTAQGTLNKGSQVENFSL
ncbi:MAG: hypothetical protein PF489_02155 [Salinivirgaceae bacterium]|jgi:hypothetical protein|nr:hypothetical protein [Salinivirgaceae bacterium]